MSDKTIRICLIGATNFPGRLDAALVRPGRMNRILLIAPPDPAALAGIARQHLGDDLPDADLSVFGELASGASGAQVAGWVTDARTAARAAGRPMRPEDLIDAAAPPDARPEEEKRRSALHEAGHAVGVEILGTGRVAQVDAVLRADRAGATTIVPRETLMPLREDLERLVIALLCGRAAETVLLGEACGGSGGSRDSDIAQATALVAGIHGSLGLAGGIAYLGTTDEVARDLRRNDALRAAVEADLARLHAEAEGLIERHADTVRAVADRLLAQRVVSGDALRAMIAGAAPGKHEAGGGR